MQNCVSAYITLSCMLRSEILNDTLLEEKKKVLSKDQTENEGSLLCFKPVSNMSPEVPERALANCYLDSSEDIQLAVTPCLLQKDR